MDGIGFLSLRTLLCMGKLPAVFNKCHNVYHKGFEITFMHGKYILPALAVILLIVSPAAGSLSKISPGAPVFIGENNMDISSGLNGCHTIAWWQNGSDITSVPAVTNLTIYAIGSDSYPIFHFNVSPAIFSGYTGTWYCVDRQPYYPVFTVNEPSINIRAWDVDRNKDVTGQSVPPSTNITYRIDTNLDPVFSSLNRPNYNPSDSPYTVGLTDPSGKLLPTLYTGNAGNPGTIALLFNSHPFISSSPYIWTNGAAWDRNARDAQGYILYPPGTYTFTLTQNLNNMQDDYNDSPFDYPGLLSKTASVTFVNEVTPVPTLTSQTPVLTAQPVVSTTIPAVQATTVPTTSPVAKKTTYAPLRRRFL